MKFLIDAQLPRRLAHFLHSLGYDALHTLDLPNGNRTTDLDLNNLSLAEQRIVITKDADFVNSLILNQVPYKLLLVSTGNITNIAIITDAFLTNNFIEINRVNIIVHK